MLTIIQLSKNTFKECMREPIYFLMLATALVMIGMFPTLSMFVFREQIKLVIDSSMATTLLFGLVVAVLCAGHTISREMKNGTVLLLMSKPVTRTAFIISKVIGILSAISVFIFICDCASFLSVLIAKDQFQLDYKIMGFYYAAIGTAALFGAIMNFLKQKSFASNAILGLTILLPVLAFVAYIIRIASIGHVAEADPEEFIAASQLIPALLLLFPSAWAMGAITVALSTRLEFVANLSVCFILFLLGLVSKYVIGQIFGTGFIASFAETLLPNWQYFWMADALASREHIPHTYLFWACLYVFFYIGFWTLWALALFSDREIAKDTR